MHRSFYGARQRRAEHLMRQFTSPASLAGYNSRMDRHGLARRISLIATVQGQFRLRSGQTATEYFDKYLFDRRPMSCGKLPDRCFRSSLVARTLWLGSNWAAYLSRRCSLSSPGPDLNLRALFTGLE